MSFVSGSNSALSSSSFFFSSSSSESVTSFSLDFSTYSSMGKPMNSECFFYQVLEPALLQELGLILLEVADHLGATLDLTMDELSVPH